MRKRAIFLSPVELPGKLMLTIQIIEVIQHQQLSEGTLDNGRSVTRIFIEADKYYPVSSSACNHP